MRLTKEKRRRRTVLDNWVKWTKGFKILLEDGINRLRTRQGTKDNEIITANQTNQERLVPPQENPGTGPTRLVALKDRAGQLKERWARLKENAGRTNGPKLIQAGRRLWQVRAGRLQENQIVQDYLLVYRENVAQAKKNQVTLLYNLRRLRAWYNRQTTVGKLGLGAAAYFVLFFSANAIFIGNACGVYVNGQQVAVVADESFAKNTLTEVIRDKSSKAGVALEINDEIYYRGVHAKKADFLDKEELKASLNSALSFNTNAVEIIINGETRICLHDRQEAEDMLKWLRSLYPAEAGEMVAFKEKVELVETVVDERTITTAEEARDMLLYGSDKVEQYVVKNGDTAWDIAAKYDVYVDTLQINNPGVDLWNIQVDQVLKLSREVPLITVLATRQYTTDEEIPYKVEERSDDKLMPGERKVIAAGTAGLRTVTYDVTRENGFEVERVELEQEVLREPTTEIVARGSQIMLASRGGGRIGWPGGGSVISAFGMRSGRMHKGVDISGAYGAPIVAAASGTVIHAATGYDGGYGTNVEISHGSGYVTKYAHMSSLNVHVGQTVQRGELIGRVGATGNAVGAHLHFEVLVNGVPQNPTSYF